MSLFKPKNNQSDLPPRRRRLDQSTPSERSELKSGSVFRRNRTITGSISSRFGSAGEDQADMMSPRAAAHSLAQKRKRVFRMLAGALAGLIFFSVLMWQLIAGVSVYASAGVALEDSKPYERTVNDYLARQPLQRFRFALDEGALVAYVSLYHPEVESVALRQPIGPGLSRMELVMREPVAEWSVSGKRQYVDSMGVAFTVNYHSAPSIQVIDDSGIDPASGAAIASSRFLSFVGHAVRLSETLGYKPLAATIPQSTTRQVSIEYEGVDYPVKYTIDRSAEDQVEDMDRAVRYLSAQGQAPEYLDVRVGGRAYYK